MSLEPKKLQKIRTFSGDVSAVRGAAAVPVPEPEERTIPTKPLVTFAPVLNERKNPIVVPPVVVKTPTPPPPAPVATAVPSSLQADITATLGGSKAPVAPLIKSLPVSSPSLTEAIEATAPSSKERVEVMDRGGDDLGGTVITNQKQDRFKLLPSMWEAVKIWFQQTEKALARRAEKKRKAIPTVRTFEDRKDLIKKAASVGAIAPKDDYAKLAQKLPPRSKEPMAPAKSTVIIAEKAAVPAPTWGHFEGQGAPVVTEVKQVTPTVTQVPPAIVVPPPMPEPEAQPIPPPPIVEPVIVTPPPPPPPRVIKPIERPAVEPVIFEKSVRTEPPPAVAETPVLKRAVAVQPTAPRAKKNFAWLFYVGVTATAVVAIVSGAGLVSWFIGDSGQTIVTVTNGPTNTLEPTPIREDSAVKAILPQTRADWYANVSASGRGGVLTVIPVVNIGGAEKTAAADEVLATLSWGVESALIRSISDITFIMAEQKPVIILKVATFDSAFGGLLLSERELSGELFPLFGPVVTSTYKVGVGTVAPEFIDELASNHDVRVLKDEMENERLVYGFVDQNTIVITPDKETFSLISERLR